MYAAGRVLGVVGILMLTAFAAWAQHPQRREGFWIGFGLGYGGADVTCDNCVNGPAEGGVTAFLKLGGTPSRNVLIGGALNGWSRDRGGATETMGNVTGSIYYYPAPTSGLFLTGGLGFSSYSTNTDPSVDATGWGFSAGVGYDIRVGRNVSLTPVVNFVFGALEEFDAPVPGGGITRVTGWQQNVIDFGLGVTFH